MILNNKEKAELKEIAQKYQEHKNCGFQFLSTETKGGQLVCTFGQFSGDSRMKPYILASIVDSYSKDDPSILLHAMDIIFDKNNRRLGRAVESFKQSLDEILKEKSDSESDSIEQ